MIAGQNIDYLPGTLVNSGAYMHGYITTNGQYCGNPPAPATHPANQTSVRVNSSQPFFKIFPNPTIDLITIEMDKDLVSSTVDMALFGTLGEPLLTEKLTGETEHVFSLSGKPAGIYYIRLISGDRTETMKIVKQ